MRRYELMLLLRPDLEDDKLQSAVEKVTRAIVNAGGSLSKVSPWGKRRLAYDIARYREASYFLIHFDIEPAQVRGIERGLLISEEILRHLVTVIGEREPRESDELPPAAVPTAEANGVEGGTEAAAESEAGEELTEATEPAAEEPTVYGEEEPPEAPEGRDATAGAEAPAEEVQAAAEAEPVTAGSDGGETAERSST